VVFVFAGGGDGTLEHYTTCDWIDNALVMHMERSREAISGAAAFAVPRGGECEGGGGSRAVRT